MSNQVDAARRAWELLFRTTTLVGRQLAGSRDAWHEVSTREWGVLFALARRDPDEVRMVDLLDDVLLSQANVSRLVVQLIERGLVSRGIDPDDRRSSPISLTDLGRAVQARTARIHQAEVASLLGKALTVAQLDELSALCRRVLANAGQESGLAAVLPV